MRMQLAPLLTLAAVVAFAAAALALAGSEATREANARKTIAEASTSDFRIVLTATRKGGGAAPTATVTATSFRRVDGRWTRTGSSALPGTYFWKTLTGPRAICRLEIRTAGPAARFTPRAVVQLLLGPSLGCGRVSSHALAG